MQKIQLYQSLYVALQIEPAYVLFWHAINLNVLLREYAVFVGNMR